MRESASIALLAVTVALVTGVTLATAPGAAQVLGNDPLDDILEPDDDEADSRLEELERDLGTLMAGLDGGKDRTVFWISSRLPSPIADLFGVDEGTPTAIEKADAVESFYNDHNASFEAWVNDRTNATTDHDVVEITWRIEGSEATRYLVANATGNDYNDTMIVNDTDRTIDDTVALCRFAAHESPDELEHFHETFVEPDEDVTREYLARMSGRYGRSVETSLIPSTSGDCEAGA